MTTTAQQQYRRFNSYGFLKLYYGDTQIASTAVPGVEGCNIIADAEQEHRRQMALNQHHFLPVAPVPPPTVEQALAFALTDLAKCKARLHKQEGCFAEALMWISAGEIDRAKQVLTQGWASL